MDTKETGRGERRKKKREKENIEKVKVDKKNGIWRKKERKKEKE